jgi:hypothetical protein
VNKFRVYCGPTVVAALARLLRQHNVEVTCEGTEHVYVRTWFTRDGLFTAVREVMAGFKYSDVQEVGR